MKFCFNKRQTSVRKYCTAVLRLAFIVVKPLSNAHSYGLFYLVQINKSKITCNRVVLHKQYAYEAFNIGAILVGECFSMYINILKEHHVI